MEQLIIQSLSLVDRHDTWIRDWNAYYSPGQTVAILGPSQSGKKHLILVCGGYLPPTEGRIVFHSQGKTKAVRPQMVGVGPMEPINPLLTYLKIEEHIYQHASLFGVREPKERVEKLIHTWELEKVRKERVKDVSKQDQLYVGIVTALVHHPRILCLYEPEQGLTEQEWEETWERLQRSQSEHSFILFMATCLERTAQRCDDLVELAQRVRK